MVIVETLWFFLPAGIANMTPVLVKRVPFLSTPLDFGRTWKGKRILGDHKTWRGFVMGILAAILVVWIQKLLYPYTTSLALIDYTYVNPVYVGFLLGFGALAGDTVKSYVKRRHGVQPGKPWVPYDQIDWIVGALIVVNIQYPLRLASALSAIVVYGLMHPVINYLGYLLRLKSTKW